MTIGTAIFLSAAMFALVALFALTRDRLNWRRIAKAGLFLIAFVGLCTAAWTAYLQWPERLRPVTEYFGARLGMPMKEITYIKGYPTNVYEAEPAPATLNLPSGSWERVVPVKEIPEGKTIRDYMEWSWEEPHYRLDITFNKEDGGVMGIQCYSKDQSDFESCEPLLGILVGSTEQGLKEKLGTPSHETIDGVTKRIQYDSLNAVFWLVQQKVYMMGYGHMATDAPTPARRDASK